MTGNLKYMNIILGRCAECICEQRISVYLYAGKWERNEKSNEPTSQDVIFLCTKKKVLTFCQISFSLLSIVHFARNAGALSFATTRDRRLIDCNGSDKDTIKQKVYASLYFSQLKCLKRNDITFWHFLFPKAKQQQNNASYESLYAPVVSRATPAPALAAIEWQIFDFVPNSAPEKCSNQNGFVAVETSTTSECSLHLIPNATLQCVLHSENPSNGTNHRTKENP